MYLILSLFVGFINRFLLFSLSYYEKIINNYN